jgi:hypothetical protein
MKMMMYLSLCLMAMLALTAVLSSITFAWTTPINITNNDTAQVIYTHPCIAVDSTGTCHVAFEAWNAKNYWGPHWIMYVSGKDTSWTTPVWLSIDTIRYSSFGPNICIDHNGRMLVAWDDERTGDIAYTIKTDTGWTRPVPLAVKPEWDIGIRMAVDGQNNVHAVWHDANGYQGIWYSKWDWNTWTTPVVIPHPLGKRMAWTDIAVDSKGHLHAVAMVYSDSLGYPLAYFKNSGTGWASMPQPPDNSSGQSVCPRLSIGRGDTVHLVWEERNPNTIMYEGWYSNFSEACNSWSPLHKLMDIDSCNVYGPQIVTAGEKVYSLWTSFKIMGIGIYYTYRDSLNQWSYPKVITTSMNAVNISLNYDNALKIHAVWRNAGWLEYSNEDVDTGVLHLPADTAYLPLTIISEIRPNPFKLYATIMYEIDKADEICLLLYNITGQLVRKYSLGYKTRGRHQYTFHADSSMHSGVYFYQMKNSRFATPVHKMIIIK